MENEYYGIPVVNKYSAFVDDEGDPFELITKQEELQKEEAAKAKKEAARAKSAPKGKKQVKSAPPPKEEKAAPTEDRTTSQGQGRKDDRPRSTRGRGGDFGGNRYQDNKAPRHQRRDDQGFGGSGTGTGNQDQVDRPPRREFRGPPRRFDDQVGEGGDQEARDRGFRGRGRGRGGFRGGMGGRRDFDRHSGSDKTGVKATDKRDGAGPHNWGTANDELKAMESGEQQPAASPEKKEWAQDGEGRDSAAVDKDPEDKENNPEDLAEPEAKEFTLDEWKAMQARPQQEFNVRKPNEGSDQGQWKKFTVLKKKATLEETDEYEEEEDSEDARKQKNITAKMNFTFNDMPQRGGRGRRGDRGGFGGRGGGRGRGEGGFESREGQQSRGGYEGGRGGGYEGRGGGFEGRGGFERREPRPERIERPERVQTRAPRLANEEEFPSLGAK